jgi:hypothetical protein
MRDTHTNGRGDSAARKPIPFYYGEAAKPTLLQHIDNVERQLLNAREMLATIEQDGGAYSGLACFYRSRAIKLSDKIERMKGDVSPVYFGA